jgi:hypothetical protein
MCAVKKKTILKKEDSMFNYYDMDEKLSPENISNVRDIVRWLLDSYYQATGLGFLL